MSSRRDRLEPVSIESRGKRLFAVLHTPPRAARDPAVVFLSAGLQNRVGPHRIYLKAARRFSELGLMSLRLDLPGVGDSDEMPLETNFDCHDPAYPPAAIDYLARRHRVQRVVLLGLCSGARVAVKVAARDPRVDGVIAWGLPIISGPVNMPVAQGGGAYMGPKKARSQLLYWAPKLISPAAWYRFLTSGKSVAEGWDMVYRTLCGLLPERMRPRAPKQTDFLRSIDSYVASGRKAFFAYGDADEIARAEFADRFREIADGSSAACEHQVVPASDHTFSSSAGQSEVITRTVDWLARSFPAAATAAG